MTEDASAVLSVEQLAKRWRLTRRSVLAMIRAGKLAAFTPGTRQYRITMAEVLRIESSGRGAA